MIIYIIIKFILSYYLVIKKKWIKDSKKLYIFLDILIINLFIYLIYINNIKLKETKEIFIVGSIILGIFLIYRGINYILKNFEYVLSWVEKKEKIKRILLKPIINKGIYYIIWSLPWNIGYWIYFWVMENGWYLKVWMNSNRDIFFWRYFKWDSRDFFFNFSKKYINIKNKDIIYEFMLRLLLVLYIIRKGLLSIEIKEYIWIRIVIYMYLSIFYLYFIFYFHILNYYLILFFIFLEIIFLIFARYIIIWIMHKWEIDDIQLHILVKKGIITNEFIDLKDMFLVPLFVDIRLKWEINLYIWDKTLSNSVTLNILYKYIIWVNERTEGYYDRIMNIRSRIHRKKHIEEKSIIWDVLPRTRYVIVSLKYFGYQCAENIHQGIKLTEEYEFINLSKNKNFYLSYYEKTYSDTSLLMLFWFLRINQTFWIKWEIAGLSEEFKQKFKKFLKNKNINEDFLYRIFLIYICKLDKRYFKEIDLFKFFFTYSIKFYLEEISSYAFKKNFVENKNKLEIPKNFIGIKNYKLIFKIMGRKQLYEEEAIVWNKELQEFLKKKEEFFFLEFTKLKDKSDKTLEECLEFSYNKFFSPVNIGLDIKYTDLEDCKKQFKSNLNFMLKTKPELEELIDFYIQDNIYYFQEFENTEFISTIWDDHGENYIFALYLYILIYIEKLNLDLKEKNIQFEYLNSKYKL